MQANTPRPCSASWLRSPVGPGSSRGGTANSLALAPRSSGRKSTASRTSATASAMVLPASRTHRPGARRAFASSRSAARSRHAARALDRRPVPGRRSPAARQRHRLLDRRRDRPRSRADHPRPIGGIVDRACAAGGIRAADPGLATSVRADVGLDPVARRASSLGIGEVEAARVLPSRHRDRGGSGMRRVRPSARGVRAARPDRRPALDRDRRRPRSGGRRRCWRRSRAAGAPDRAAGPRGCRPARRRGRRRPRRPPRRSRIERLAHAVQPLELEVAPVAGELEDAGERVGVVGGELRVEGLAAREQAPGAGEIGDVGREPCG